MNILAILFGLVGLGAGLWLLLWGGKKVLAGV